MSFMNPAQLQYATAIMDELRGWAHEWLAGLRASRALQRTLALPLPHPNYPLPSGFPFGNFALSQRFEWIHEYGAEQLRHVYSVDFALHGRMNGPGSSVAWNLVTEGPIQLGVFEIAGRIYDDALLPFEINTDLVLEAMLASLIARAPIRLASHDIAVGNVQPGAPPQYMRVYELCTPNGAVLRELGARRMS
ncbi:hypothetical protein FB451DRAFT_1228396 [Mycena latifolia]|nr:hypothetical protein FB451DRAFT_1228396 [Mycena latifolia]